MCQRVTNTHNLLFTSYWEIHLPIVVRATKKKKKVKQKTKRKRHQIKLIPMMWWTQFIIDKKNKYLIRAWMRDRIEWFQVFVNKLKSGARQRRQRWTKVWIIIGEKPLRFISNTAKIFVTAMSAIECVCTQVSFSCAESQTWYVILQRIKKKT